MLHNYRMFQDKAADASLLHWEQSINPHQIVKNVQYFDILRSYLRLAPMRILAFLVSSSRSLHRNFVMKSLLPSLSLLGSLIPFRQLSWENLWFS